MEKTTRQVVSEKRKTRVELIVFGILFLLVTAYFSYASIWSYMQQWKASFSFVSVPATILQSEVKSRGSPIQTRGESFYPFVLYRYSVDGKDYESSNFSYFGSGWTEHEAAKQVADQFPVGTMSQAFYSPSQPSDAVLNKEKPKMQMLLSIAPFWIIGIVVTAIGVRSFKSPAKHKP